MAIATANFAGFKRSQGDSATANSMLLSANAILERQLGAAYPASRATRAALRHVQ